VGVLLERLLVSRPHPWGLLVTAYDLFKNPAYNFWDYPFVHACPMAKQILQDLFFGMKREEANLVALARQTPSTSITASLATSRDDGTNVFHDFMYDHSMENLAGLEHGYI